MSEWLLDRLFDAKDQAEPRFAFQGTVNWLRALAEIVNNDDSLTDEELKNFYSKVQRRKVNIEADTTVFENIHMAFHNYASLISMNKDNIEKYDICRSAIIAWYYTVYFASSAMVAASSGSSQETHSATAKVWQADIIEQELIPYPYNLHTTSLVQKTTDEEIEIYRDSNIYDLNHYPSDSEEAHGAIVSYLKGTCKYKKGETEERIKSSKDYKALGVSNFRKKVARELRDRVLEKGQVNFLVQAFRYRGKANYRDSIFLSYGNDNEIHMKQFISDLLDVSANYLKIASHYCSRRVEKGTWDLFVDDLDDNTRLAINTDIVKV